MANYAFWTDAEYIHIWKCGLPCPWSKVLEIVACIRFLSNPLALDVRVPKYSPSTLTNWYRSESPTRTVSLLRYLTNCAFLNIEILNQSEVVTKTAWVLHCLILCTLIRVSREFARVFGVDFYSVISRGSQFKVESFMFRIAKPESFVLISPSKSDVGPIKTGSLGWTDCALQVGKQNAAECLPLIMEPQSALYTSPLVVLDFQSLYPSLMISQVGLDWKGHQFRIRWPI